ncbi:hypothetical protein KG088_19255 [Halomonas sp. TRM85114]|uniref:hypothetical protein n=1 Tax=Halomonas jincaotanensis TaxID=2810616 RepID=UPI001BD54962|nr:hypothetical protein [Halomonas jincaotanensis]MBS9405715.1 hypothetical protein [Halomonas jincaotanensis]
MDDRHKAELEELYREMERLKVLRDGRGFEPQPGKDFAQELPGLFESIPSSVRGRVLERAKYLGVAGDAQLEMLWQEARALLLYDAIYADIDAEHDLSNPILSRAVRDYINHSGRVPNVADRDVLLDECPPNPCGHRRCGSKARLGPAPGNGFREAGPSESPRNGQNLPFLIST